MSRPLILILCFVMWIASFNHFINVNNDIRVASRTSIAEMVDISPTDSTISCDTLSSIKAQEVCQRGIDRNKELSESPERKAITSGITERIEEFDNKFIPVTLSELQYYSSKFFEVIKFDATYKVSEGKKVDLLNKLDDVQKSSEDASVDIIKMLYMLFFPVPVLFWIVMALLNKAINKKENFGKK